MNSLGLLNCDPDYHDKRRAFVSTRSLIHKEVKISVDEWIMETTCKHKHVQIPENQIFLPHMIISQLYFI